MKTPKVSVLMPVYNTQADFLTEAIDSILNQTFTDFEFIIIDDGSTHPDVKKVIHSYKDKRIKYVYKENSGIADTSNYGMKKLCSGEYIARMDSDDISLPDRLKKQVAFLDAHPDVSVVSALYERFPDYFIPNHPEQVGVADMLRGDVVANPLVMLRKDDFLSRNLLHERKYAEDYDLWARTVMAGLKIVNIQEILLKYRWHPDNISHTKAQECASDTNEIKKSLIQFMSGDLMVQDKLAHLFDSQGLYHSKK